MARWLGARGRRNTKQKGAPPEPELVKPAFKEASDLAVRAEGHLSGRGDGPIAFLADARLDGTPRKDGSCRFTKVSVHFLMCRKALYVPVQKGRAASSGEDLLRMRRFAAKRTAV